MKKHLAAVVLCLLSLRTFADETRPWLMVVGMASEAAAAAGDNTLVVISAGNRQQLEAALHDPKYSRVRAVISFGTAGALDPALKTGDVLLPSAAMSTDGSWSADPALLSEIGSRLTRAGLNFQSGTIYTVDAPVADPQSRADLRVASGAALSDMESAVAAAFAARNGLPFVAIRAVTDTAAETLPPAALIPLKADGNPDGDAIGKSLQKDPGQLPALMHLNDENQAALKALRSCRQSL